MMAQVTKYDPNMYFDELNLKMVDDKMQFIVFGYIKNAQKIINNQLFNK